MHSLEIYLNHELQLFFSLSLFLTGRLWRIINVELDGDASERARREEVKSIKSGDFIQLY